MPAGHKVLVIRDLLAATASQLRKTHHKQWEEKVLREKLLNRGKHISNDRRKSGFVGKRRVEGFKWGGQTYFVVNQSGRRFNLSYTGILLENVFQYREKYRELRRKIQVTQGSLGDATPSRERGRGGEEGRGEAVKFMGSQTTTWMSLLSLVSTKFHLFPCGIWIRTCNCRFMVPSAVLIWGRKELEKYEVGSIDKLSPIFGKCPPVTSQRGLTAFKGCCASIVDLTLFHHHETLCSEF